MGRRRVDNDIITDFYTHGIDISTKTLYLGFGEDEEVALDEHLTREMLKGLHILSRIRPDDSLRILMNCEGGDVQCGLAIYDMIQKMNCQVVIDVYGCCYSMGAWILQAADVRRMSRYSSMMIHNGDTSISGRKDELKSWKKFYDEADVLCEHILLERIRERHPDFPKKKLDKMLATDTVLWAHEALELGLIDEII